MMPLPPSPHSLPRAADECVACCHGPAGTDTYGAHGVYCADGINAIADALPRSYLVTLLCNGNGLRDEGAAAMARALVSTPQGGTLTTLALEGNAIGVEGCKALATALHGRPGVPGTAPPGTALLGRPGMRLPNSAVPGATVPGGAMPGGAGLPEAQEALPATPPPPPPSFVIPCSLTSLDLSNNMICGVSTLFTAEGPRRPAPYSSSALRALLQAVQRSSSLTQLSLANNRLCGIWSDAYGQQQFGSWELDGAMLLADCLRCRTTQGAERGVQAGGAGAGGMQGGGGNPLIAPGTTLFAPALRHLDVSSNALGPTGGKILYDALREHETSRLTHLDMHHSRLDEAAERHLTELASKRMTLTLLLHPNGAMLTRQ